jgi:hypothetical protein
LRPDALCGPWARGARDARGGAQVRCRDAPPQRLLDALEMKPRAHAGSGGVPRERPDQQGAGAGKDGGSVDEGKEDAGEGGGAAEVVPLRSSKSA